MAHQNLSLRMCWKLFWATLNEPRPRTFTVAWVCGASQRKGPGNEIAIKCFICLSKSGVWDNGKRFVERQRAKKTISGGSQMDFIDELRVNWQCAILILRRRAKVPPETFSSSLDISSIGFENHGATRTSKPFGNINPLTPVPHVTASDETWPFFHFWRHHFWPKLASSILSFCRRKRSFQWCPDQSDRLNRALDMHKNAQKVEWKTQSKISCHYTWLLHAKICPSRWRFLRSFLNASKPSRRSITAAKRKEKEKKGRRKENSKKT